jgi:hypothetical protein
MVEACAFDCVREWFFRAEPEYFSYRRLCVFESFAQRGEFKFVGGNFVCRPAEHAYLDELFVVSIPTPYGRRTVSLLTVIASVFIVPPGLRVSIGLDRYRFFSSFGFLGAHRTGPIFQRGTAVGR